jgi:hypothetical protein
MEVDVAVVKITFFGLNGRGRRLLSQSRYAALDLVIQTTLPSLVRLSYMQSYTVRFRRN